MGSLSDWFCANKLSLNISKTHFLLFRPKPTQQELDVDELKIGNRTIQRMRTITFLGLYIDDGLEWGDHIEHIA